MLWTRESSCACLYSFGSLADPVHVSVSLTLEACGQLVGSAWTLCAFLSPCECISRSVVCMTLLCADIRG